MMVMSRKYFTPSFQVNARKRAHFTNIAYLPAFACPSYSYSYFACLSLQFGCKYVAVLSIDRLFSLLSSSSFFVDWRLWVCQVQFPSSCFLYRLSYPYPILSFFLFWNSQHNFPRFTVCHSLLVLTMHGEAHKEYMQEEEVAPKRVKEHGVVLRALSISCLLLSVSFWGGLYFLLPLVGEISNFTTLWNPFILLKKS